MLKSAFTKCEHSKVCSKSCSYTVKCLQSHSSAGCVGPSFTVIRSVEVARSDEGEGGCMVLLSPRSLILVSSYSLYSLYSLDFLIFMLGMDPRNVRFLFRLRHVLCLVSFCSVGGYFSMLKIISMPLAGL